MVAESESAEDDADAEEDVDDVMPETVVEETAVEMAPMPDFSKMKVSFLILLFHGTLH